MLSTGRARLIAVGLRLPRMHEWGPSDSINAVVGPAMDDGVLIEMNSGDGIELLADNFELVQDGVEREQPR